MLYFGFNKRTCLTTDRKRGKRKRVSPNFRDASFLLSFFYWNAFNSCTIRIW